ncbi:histidine phosphatase family protein [Amphibacillus sp. Q70]|uniref:histidine phosphatase family protein n=1 Tax=Amphibacillus sp. Q70 TaxID=3453416 RepID=UPI003F85729A
MNRTDKEDFSTDSVEEVILYVVRHGKTMLNEADRVQGWADAVLTPEGEEVVGYAGKGLANIEFMAAYSSDSGRSIQTANIILEANKRSKSIALETDSRLREFNFGSYEGELNAIMWTDIAESQGKTSVELHKEGLSPRDFANSVANLDKERVDPITNWPAENYDMVTKRLKESIDEITKIASENGGGNILVVSHGLSINTIVDIFSENNDERLTKGLLNGSVTKIHYKAGNYNVVTVGDMSHVEEGQKDS